MGVNESTAYRIIRAVEDTLIQSGCLTLPGKKHLHAAEHEIEVIVVDVTETPVERPQKTEKVLFWQEKTAHPQISSRRRAKNWSYYLYGTRVLAECMTCGYLSKAA